MPLIIKNYDPEIADNPNHILGLSENILENVDYVESITDIIGLRDNPLPNDLPEDQYTWNLGEAIWDKSYEWSSFNLIDVGYPVSQFEQIGLIDSPTYVYIITDSETDCYDIIVVSGDAHDNTKIWNKDYEYVSDPFDLDLSVPVIDKIGLIDIIREWVSIVYDEWEVTIWNYEEQWNREKEWIWEGKGTIISLTTGDICGFNELISTNMDYLIPVPDIFGFDDDFPFILAAIFVFDYLGLNENSSFLPSIYDKDLTDIHSYNDSLTINYYDAINLIIDKIGLKDTLLNNTIYWNYNYDECAFKDHKLYTKDHILYWRSRTQNYVMGYGGGPYGNFEYGGGESNDIKEFRVQVFNRYSELLRDAIISFPDKTDDDPHFVYSWVDNLTDNTWYDHLLTFDVYEIDTMGIYSEKRTVTRPNITPLSISNCSIWLNADSLSGSSGGVEISTFPDMSGNNNNFTKGSGSARVYNTGPRGHNFVWTGYNGYYWSSLINDSIVNVGNKISIFAVGFCTGGTSYGTEYSYFLTRDFGSAPRFYLGYRSNRMDIFHFDGDVYAAYNTIDGNFHLWSATIGGSGIDSYAYKDGILLAHNQNGVYSFTNRLRIGGGSVGPCYMCEVIVYNRVLNSTELDDIHGYLMHKYF